jgi:glycosyltransferase involved in cell wall biosynthesis
VRCGRTILFVSEKFPWPLDDGGQIRTYQILRSLAVQFSVILVATDPLCPQDKEAIQKLGIEVITVPRHRNHLMLPWYVLGSLFTKRPYPLPKNFSRRLLNEIRHQVSAGRVQAIHLNHLDAAQYVDWLDEFRSEVKIVFDTHNLLAPLYERLLNVEPNYLRKLFIWVQSRKMNLYERATIQKADCVAVCSTVERDILCSWGLNACLVVPNGVDTEFYTPAPVRSVDGRPLALVFTGAMDYLPNADGIRWFLRCVSPKLDKLEIQYKITIVGKNPPADLLAWELPGKIEFTGRVVDVRPYTHSADLFVVPLQVGGGTRLKILEALAMKVPVVSTRVGAEGLELHDGIHLRVVDDASTMAQTIAELSALPDRGQEMAHRGREYVSKKYDWAAVTAPLSRFYASELYTSK